MPGFVPIQPTQNEFYEFFEYIISDNRGKIGETYVNFHNILSYFLTITPEEFHNYYIQFKRSYHYNYNDVNLRDQEKDNIVIQWLPGDENESLRCVKRIYSYLQKEQKNSYGKVVSDEECPKTFRLVRDLWLYIWH